MQFKWAIAEQAAQLAGIKPEEALTAVEIPKIEGVADFALCVAKLNRYTKLKGKPADIAVDWANKVIISPPRFQSEFVADVVNSAQFTPTPLLTSAKGDGPYINYTVDKIPLAEEVLKMVYGLQDQWGTSNEGNGKTIVVEYRCAKTSQRIYDSDSNRNLIAAHPTSPSPSISDISGQQ